MDGQQLIQLLAKAFDYTDDNNRDLLLDPTFDMAAVEEELQVNHHYQFLIAYISRNREMIDLNLQDD